MPNPADTARASHRPDIAAACDSLTDRLLETIAPHLRPGCIPAAREALDAALAEESGLHADRESLFLEMCRAIYGDTRHEPQIRLIALSALATVSRSRRSYQEMADEFAVTRACPHNHSRRLEKHFGVRPRRAKSDEARAKSTAAATVRERATLCDAPASGVLRGRSLFAAFPGLG